MANTYLERFPYSTAEKSNKPEQKASSEKIENFLFEYEKLLENLGDDFVTRNGNSLIDDICTEKEHCRQCFGEIVEAYEFDNLVRTCNCDVRYS
jgi:hypothetical protein